MKDPTVSHVLLDIEGTTCPVSFVGETLFPYAAKHLPAYLQRHANEPNVQQLLAGVEDAWHQDPDPRAQQLRRQEDANVGDYLLWLISQDRKLTELKDLQGLIWRNGYASADLVAPLYADVPAALRRWHQQGLVLAVYSSGSVGAQQLLYGHSDAGDLRELFRHWYDTRMGPKQETSSYEAIAQAMGVATSAVLFVSDALAECEAADRAGMQVQFSDREGNPNRNAGRFARINTFDNLLLNLEP